MSKMACVIEVISTQFIFKSAQVQNDSESRGVTKKPNLLVCHFRTSATLWKGIRKVARPALTQNKFVVHHAKFQKRFEALM